MESMTRAVVSVATGAYVRGGDRLRTRLVELGEMFQYWRDEFPPTSPPHSRVPYAFKASAMAEAFQSFDTLLWCDACIYPVKPLTTLWERIERDGYWIGYNGFVNATWTAMDAYADLGITPEENSRIPHVVATAFGVSMKHSKGRAILAEYVRLGLHTGAFCGPWTNGPADRSGRTWPCGPPEVRGHRHDQTCLSVVAWRNDAVLTSSPEVFAYGKVGDKFDERTILVADGGY